MCHWISDNLRCCSYYSLTAMHHSSNTIIYHTTVCVFLKEWLDFLMSWNGYRVNINWPLLTIFFLTLGGKPYFVRKGLFVCFFFWLVLLFLGPDDPSVQNSWSVWASTWQVKPLCFSSGSSTHSLNLHFMISCHTVYFVVPVFTIQFQINSASSSYW